MKINPIEVVSVSQIQGNTKNPRYIKEKEFKELVASVRNFPKMMEARPIIVDENGIILGGNMRYKAALELGYKEVHIVRITDATEEQKREFIIKDNVSKGEWDWDMLANEWDSADLSEWGLEVVSAQDNEFNDLSDKVKTKFAIEVICKDEQSQEHTYNKLIELGYECRILTL
jgi:hypothetical protein